ncbi:unnamed protein product [Prunus brigantina]
MDFVFKLPRTQNKHDGVWVIVDRLTKSAHFLPVRANYTLNKLAKIFIDEIVRLHGVPVTIVSDRDPRFTSRFWAKLNEAFGTQLQFSTAFHPQTDGQSERTIQTLEDMLRACALQFRGDWDEKLPLMEFAYNNSYQASIKMSPYDALYGKQCRTPFYWDEVGENRLEVSEDVERTKKQVEIIRERLKAAQDRQKSYADNRRKDLQFEVGDWVFLKLSPWKGVIRFGKRGKLSPRYIGPYEIVERVGPVAYRLALPSDMSRLHDVFHVSMLRKYIPDPSHVLEEQPIELAENLTYVEQPVQILDWKTQVLRTREIPLVKPLPSVPKRASSVQPSNPITSRRQPSAQQLELQKNRWGLTEFPSLRSPSTGHQIGHVRNRRITNRSPGYSDNVNPRSRVMMICNCPIVTSLTVRSRLDSRDMCTRAPVDPQEGPSKGPASSDQ